jgi:hypothetical protein
MSGGNGIAEARVMDLQYAWRNLSRSPGFSALMILTLALGIGATTTMFSVVWAVLLRPLPLPAPDRLVTVWQNDPRSPEGRQRVTPANFVDWSAQASSFEALGVLPNWTGKPWPFNVVGRDGMERVQGIYASSGFFRVAGVAPMLGRTFEAEEDRTRGRRTVVISYPYWRAKFASDPAVIGRTLDIDTFRGGLFTVVGVMPPAFDFPRGASIWLSLGDWGGGPMPAPDAPDRCCPWYTVLGRLKLGTTVDGARRELQTILAKALRLTGAGVALGLVGAYLAARWISSLFYGVRASDPLTLGATCVLLMAAATVATASPTRRALSVDPADALRTE